MPWFKVDDKLHSHKKAARAGMAALGLWVVCGSWAMDQLTDGFVPDYIARRFDPDADANAATLVRIGMWEPGEHEGDTGWWFHDWSDHQPTRDSVHQRRDHEREKKRQQRRGSSGRYVEMSPGVSPGDTAGTPQGSPQGSPSGSPTVPTRPDPTRPHKATASSSKIASDPDAAPSPDVIDLCEHLATQVRRNGHHAKPGKHWHRQCRLMLDIDGRTPEQIRAAIDWATRDPFWSANIRSMATLREKYSTLQAQAQRPTPTTRRTQQQETDDLFAAAAIRMGVTQPPNGHQLERATL